MGKILGKKIKFSSFQIIIIGFMLVILAGSILLMLPFSSRSGEVTPFFDALFTATSATCVTGLAVQDTATYWSEFGHAVILLMIQIGGMGVVTIAVSIAVISGKKIGLMQRSTMQEAIQAPNVGGIVRLTSFILKMTFAIELVGALLLMPVFCKDLGVAKGIWYSFFHSISAFCNAGFDLMGETSKFSSLTSYYDNILLNIVIIALIIVGGIGFLTWEDIKSNGFHFSRYRMQSKVILVTTLILLVVPFFYYYFGEMRTDNYSDLSSSQKVIAAAFQTVSPRTAGFNTVDLTKLSESGKTITILLMLIGGSPGSTAGGMKTTTIAVLFMTLVAVFKRKEDVECFGRRLEVDAIKNAAAILMMYITLFVAGGVVISRLEGLPILTCFFETSSAIGTVGLTLGITPGLGAISRAILIVLMFLGRVGGLTIIFATIADKQKTFSRMTKERITVG